MAFCNETMPSRWGLLGGESLPSGDQCLFVRPCGKKSVRYIKEKHTTLHTIINTIKKQGVCRRMRPEQLPCWLASEKTQAQDG